MHTSAPDPTRPDGPTVGTVGLHAGVLVPWANSVVEAELPRWAGASVVWHYARLVPPCRSTALDEDFLAGLLAAAPAALGQLAGLNLRSVYLACTSAAFIFPGQTRSVAAGAQVPVITAFDAIVDALQRRGAGRIVLLTPYPADICEAERSRFDSQGIAVTAHASLCMTDGYAAVGESQIQELAIQVGLRATKEAQAIVLSCTGWPTFGLVERLRRQLGRPVISSNLAIARHALRAAGGVRS
jgi:maleate isomerase